MTGSKLQSDAQAATRLWLPAIIAALITGAILGLIGFDRYSRPLFDFWQRAAPRSLEKTDVRIVWIDDASIKTIGPWPWPRYIMARLTETLAAGKPKAIGYDIIFPDPDRNTPEAFASLYPELPAATASTIRALPSMDDVFSRVIGSSPVVLARAGLDTESKEAVQPLLADAQFSKPLPSSVRAFGSGLGNLPVLEDAALGHGLANGSFDSDGVARRVPLVAKVGGTDLTGLAFEIARVASGVEQVDPVNGSAGLKALKFDGRTLPVSPDGSARIRFGRFPEAATISAADLLAGNAAPSSVADKIVIVGLNAAGTADIVGSPIEPQTYGTLVQAEAIDAILRDGLIARPDWAWGAELAIAIAIMALALIVAPRLRPAQVVALAVSAAVATIALSALVFYRFAMMIDATGPLLVGTGACVAMVALSFVNARRALFEARLASARAAGELSAARDIQLGMLPDRRRLEAFDQHVDLDALIEPARSIGGDFYDVIRLDAHRVCFLIGDVTGKGVPAALFMALSKALSKSVLLREADDLGAAVTRLNTEIARDNSEDMFVTMLFGVLDTRTGRLDLCNAGHENPYRVDTQGAVSLVEIDGGPPLCVAPDFPYDVESITLGFGESIVIVSDGITEAQSPEGDFFGHERLSAVLTDWQASSPVSAASNALLREVRAFENGAEATDDLTVLVLRYTGPTAT